MKNIKEKEKLGPEKTKKGRKTGEKGGMDEGKVTTRKKEKREER